MVVEIQQNFAAAFRVFDCCCDSRRLVDSGEWQAQFAGSDNSRSLIQRGPDLWEKLLVIHPEAVDIYSLGYEVTLSNLNGRAAQPRINYEMSPAGEYSRYRHRCRTAHAIKTHG